LLSDTLFGESDVAYFLLFVGLLVFAIGLFFCGPEHFRNASSKGKKLDQKSIEIRPDFRPFLSR
jgi:hypothetical protein